MDKKYYELDGRTNGFSMWIFDNNDFIKNQNGKRMLFKSIELAKAYAFKQFNIHNSYEYKLWIVLDDLEIDYDDIELVNGIYEYYHNSEIYLISPCIRNLVTRLGYFVFEDGDKKLTEKEYGKNRSKELFGYIKDALTDLIKQPSVYPIQIITTDKLGHLCVPIKNSTFKVHICFNHQIMTLNQKRKSEECRCLPYEKSMDKYTTIYTYITKDVSEPKKISESEEEAIKIQEAIINFLSNKYPEIKPKYTGVEFHGNIYLEG